MPPSRRNISSTLLPFGPSYSRDWTPHAISHSPQPERQLRLSESGLEACHDRAKDEATFARIRRQQRQSAKRLRHGLDVLLNSICIMRSFRAPMIRVNHSILPHMSAVDLRGSYSVESRTFARKRGGKSPGWRSRLTRRLCEASSAASKADGEPH